MTQNLDTTTNWGVEYYNKEQQRITKDNLLVASPATMTKKNDFLSSSSGLAPASLSHQAVAFAEVNLGVPDETIVVASEEGFTLNESMIERAPIQLWDNGESAFRRYKLKVRLNLVGSKENPEFIASLTKDFRNFKKYIPAECKDHIVEKAGEIRKAIKAKHGSFPYIGKFHLSTSYVNGKRSKSQNQIEPWTFAAVWWDPEERGWSGVLCIHDWVYEFDLFEENLTAKQKSAGCKAATLYINPTHDKRVRPKTWAQQMSEKAAK